MSKISGYGSGPVVTGGSRVTAPDRPASGAGQAPAAGAAGDSVTLTSSARTLQKLGDAVAAAPVVDAARVDAVKSAIAGNTYQVQAQRVADKLIASDRELPKG